MHKGSNFSISSLTLVIFYFIDHNGGEVASHCGFHLHFSKTSEVEHLFIRLLAIYISSLEKCIFKFFAHFLKSGCSTFLWLTCRSSLYILNFNPLPDTGFAEVFFHSVGCLFTLLIVPCDKSF